MRRHNPVKAAGMATLIGLATGLDPSNTATLAAATFAGTRLVNATSPNGRRAAVLGTTTMSSMGIAEAFFNEHEGSACAGAFMRTLNEIQTKTERLSFIEAVFAHPEFQYLVLPIAMSNPNAVWNPSAPTGTFKSFYDVLNTNIGDLPKPIDPLGTPVYGTTWTNESPPKLYKTKKDKLVVTTLDAADVNAANDAFIASVLTHVREALMREQPPIRTPLTAVPPSLRKRTDTLSTIVEIKPDAPTWLRRYNAFSATKPYTIDVALQLLRDADESTYPGQVAWLRSLLRSEWRRKYDAAATSTEFSTLANLYASMPVKEPEYDRIRADLDARRTVAVLQWIAEAENACLANELKPGNLAASVEAYRDVEAAVHKQFAPGYTSVWKALGDFAFNVEQLYAQRDPDDLALACKMYTATHTMRPGAIPTQADAELARLCHERLSTVNQLDAATLDSLRGVLATISDCKQADYVALRAAADARYSVLHPGWVATMTNTVASVFGYMGDQADLARHDSASFDRHAYDVSDEDPPTEPPSLRPADAHRLRLLLAMS